MAEWHVIDVNDGVVDDGEERKGGDGGEARLWLRGT
jgi:hypothetical protein